MSHTKAQIASRPDCWRRAIALARDPAGPVREALPRAGERVAVVGCGTSWFIAQSYAALREAAGQGETDAVQRLAVAIAAARGLDPDEPRHLTRSVILG